MQHAQNIVIGREDYWHVLCHILRVNVLEVYLDRTLNIKEIFVVTLHKQLRLELTKVKEGT